MSQCDEWVCHKGLELPPDTELGDGAQALRDNFTRIVDSLSGPGLAYETEGLDECGSHLLSVKLSTESGLRIESTSNGLRIDINSLPQTTPDENDVLLLQASEGELRKVSLRDIVELACDSCGDTST